MAESTTAPVKHGSLTVTKVNVKEAGEHIYSLAYSPDGLYLAATFGNGSLRIFDGQTFAAIQRAKLGAGFDDLPSTKVVWRPAYGPEHEEGVYELATVSSVGGVFGWNFDVSDASAPYLDRLWKQSEEGNETAAVDYSPDGNIIATAGSDRIVRVYDANTKGKLLTTMEKGKDDAGHTRPAHTNRIFSLKFVTQHLILTGGWEAPVQVWDLRTGHSERQISGPQISSDGIESTPGSQSVFTASKRDSRQLQVYDFLSGRENEQESAKLSANVGKNALSAVRFSPESQTVWTATTKPEVLLCLNSSTGEVKGSIDHGHLGSILCLERCPTMPKRLAVGSMKEGLFIIDLA
jgi:WD40 repeat protein